MVNLVSILKSRRFRWTIRILAIVVILLGVAAVLFPGKVLTVDSGAVQADVIIVLGGAPHDRAERAADLFKEGAAPRVLISGIGDDRRNKNILLQAGVPADAIQVESESFTTRENAQFTIPLLRALGAKRVIIVTSWFHSRRALHTFRHYAPNIQFYSRPSYYGFPGKIPDYALNSIAAYKQSHLPAVSASGSSNFSVSASQPFSSTNRIVSKTDWRGVRAEVKSEYIKLIGYWVYYGVWPF